MAARGVELGSLGDLARAVTNPRPFLRTVGALQASRCREAFRRQGRGRRWPARGVPNVAGIVADLERGSRPPARRFTPRPAGIDTAALRNSITYSVVGRDGVDLVAPVSYAERVQRGGSARVTLSASIRPRLAKFLRSGRGRRWRARLGWLFTAQRRDGGFTVSVPARPFLEVLPSDVREFEALWERYARERTR